MASHCIGVAAVTPDEKVFYQTLGQRIAALRKEHGITKVQLAETLGIAQQTLAHYEVDRLRVAASLVPPLARAPAVTENRTDQPASQGQAALLDGDAGDPKSPCLVRAKRSAPTGNAAQIKKPPGAGAAFSG